ncbi:MAG: amidase family protein, partial [Pseudomonadota bacterium]
MTLDLADATATEVAAAVSGGRALAREVAEDSLSRIDAQNPAINAFTDVTRARMLREADSVDAMRSSGQALGPLAGVPFAVKNLFDLAGVVTLAGSKLRRSALPAVG